MMRAFPRCPVPSISWLLPLLVGVAGLAAVTSPGTAQVIPIRTVPVATGDQFLVFPSDRLGMASVAIAVQDTTGDPFSNPATLTRVDGTRLFTAPTAYGITGGNGGAITLPVGAFLDSDGWHGGFALAFQELDRGGARRQVFPSLSSWAPPPSPNRLDQRSRSNLYAFAAVARSLGEGATSIGASLSLADLSALGGVDLLYDRRPIDQRGSLVDLRLGLATGWVDGSALEAVLVHTRLEMEHDLVDLVWVPTRQPDLPPEEWSWQWETVERTEHDETNTWGFHVDYTRPLDAEGWEVGARVTGNVKSHPKIPNYTLMSIPRDPGDSWAWDFGVGLGKRTPSSVLGIDLVYEPVWTETWADAAAPTPTLGGDTIPAGDMTVFNAFRFDNAILRAGLSGHLDRLQLAFGIQLKRYAYTLDQTDFVMERRRRQRESWIEWTPTLSLGLDLDDFAIRYTGRVTTGTGRPGVITTGSPVLADAALALGVDFLPAPSDALTLDEVMVHTHQVSVSIPFGR